MYTATRSRSASVGKVLRSAMARSTSFLMVVFVAL
jgi:hypothetical protein